MATDEEVKVKPVDVDIMSADLQMEEIDINPEGDAFSSPPPAPEGIYMSQLSKGEGKSWQQGTSKKGQKYLAIAVAAKLVLGENVKYDGALVFDNFVSTMVMDNSGTCRIAGILKAAGQPVQPGKQNAADLARQFDAFLSGDPSIKIQTKWEGYCKTCEKTVLKSMLKFPPNPAGGHKGEANCPKCGDTVTAKAVIEKYLPVS